MKRLSHQTCSQYYITFEILDQFQIIINIREAVYLRIKGNKQLRAQGGQGRDDNSKRFIKGTESAVHTLLVFNINNMTKAQNRLKGIFCSLFFCTDYTLLILLLIIKYLKISINKAVRHPHKSYDSSTQWRALCITTTIMCRFLFVKNILYNIQLKPKL